MNPRKHRKELSDDERLALYQFLLRKSSGERIPKGITSQAAEQFGVSARSVQRIWSYGKGQQNEIAVVQSLKKRRKGRSGRKRVDEEAVKEALRAVPFSQRRTLRGCSAATGFAVTTLWKVLQRGAIRRMSNSLKPVLTEENKIARVKWALSHIDENSLQFSSMSSVIHLDEKWFYLSEETLTLYLADDEPPPKRSCKSKRFVPKVMFLCAVARPRFDDDGVCTFDGKIGMWPFTQHVPAQRNSRNRPKGTLELKNVVVTQEVYKSFLIEKVIPAVFEKWPGSRPFNVTLQQDNARSHVSVDNAEVAQAGRRNRSVVSLTAQPPNSPDFNILDLGFFRAIQALRYKTNASSTQELVEAVHAAFVAFEPQKLDDNFVSLQACLESSMKNSGGNHYKQPHVHKARHRREGDQIKNIHCDSAVFNLAKNIINESDIGTSSALGPQ